MTSLFAVTVIGHDRPGIIAATTDGLAGLGLNIEDSTMTLLRGHFAMMLLCSDEGARERVAPSEIEHALSSLTADGDLEVFVRVRPCIPTGRGSRLKSDSVWVRTPAGAPQAGGLPSGRPEAAEWSA